MTRFSSKSRSTIAPAIRAMATGMIGISLTGCTITILPPDGTSDAGIDGNSSNSGPGVNSGLDDAETDAPADFGFNESAGNGSTGDANNGNQDTDDGDDATAMAYALVEAVIQDDAVSQTSRFAGDGFSSKRAWFKQSYPGWNELVAGGPEQAEAILDQFEILGTAEDDDTLFLFAMVIEEMDYTPGVSRLASYLEANMTGAAVRSLSAATHTLRALTGEPQDDSGEYLQSEIEETLRQLGRAAPKSMVAAKANRETCWKGFVLVDDEGTELRYPADHPDPNKAGQLIKVGGNVHSLNSVPDGLSRSLHADVVAGGGVYVDGGTEYRGQPTNQLNCAGYVFREVNDGEAWTAYPQKWYQALRAAGAMELVSEGSVTAQPGDIVFYFGRGDSNLPAHVAEVHEVEFGLFGSGVTVRNADGMTGLFDANVSADFFDTRYDLSKTQVWRLTGGQLPNMKVNLDRNEANSCHGDDTDGDGFPDSDTCEPNFRCIDPEFAFGQPGACCHTGGECTMDNFQVCTALGGVFSGEDVSCDEAACPQPPEYVVWHTGNVCCWGAPIVSITTRDTFEQPRATASFPGGGIDYTIPAVKTEMQGGFASYEDAQAWLCPQQVSKFNHRWCGSYVQMNGANWQIGGLCDTSNLPWIDGEQLPDVNGCE